MIGQAIKTARKAAGLTQEDLAKAIGVKRSVVSKYENGQIGPRYETVERIAETLNCSISDLVSSTQEKEMIINHLIDQLQDIHCSSVNSSAVDSVDKTEDVHQSDPFSSEDKTNQILALFTGVGGKAKPAHPVLARLMSNTLQEPAEYKELWSIIEIYLTLNYDGRTSLYRRALELKKLNGLTLNDLEDE